jgi:hypothetical protein
VAQFLNDTFTEGTSTTLNLHTGETGATWTRIFDGGGSSSVVANGYANFATAQIWTASGTPAGADYEVSTVNTYQGNSSADFHQTGPAGRLAGTGDGYAAVWRTDAGQIQLLRLDNGVRTIIGTSNQTTPSSGTNVTLTLRMVGSTISVRKDGAEVISVTDATYSATGKAGLHGRAASYAGSLSGQTDGWPITSITADDVVGSSITLSQVERNSITRGLNRGLS